MQAQRAVYHTFPHMTRRIFLIPRFAESFAPRSDLLLSTVTKVGKSTGRNLQFLHLRARYRAYRFVTACHTFTQNFLFRFVKRIVSAPAPLPLMPTPNNAVGSTVDNISGSGAGRKLIRRGVKKTCRGHVFSLRSRRLCRRSIHQILKEPSCTPAPLRLVLTQDPSPFGVCLLLSLIHI